MKPKNGLARNKTFVLVSDSHGMRKIQSVREGRFPYMAELVGFDGFLK